MGAREEITRAVIAGREAGARGEEPTVCPYPSTSTLRTAWIRGYAETRPLSSYADNADETGGAD